MNESSPARNPSVSDRPWPRDVGLHSSVLPVLAHASWLIAVCYAASYFPDSMTMRDKLDLLERRRGESEQGGGAARI
jgi:hypothetical protein